MSSHAADDAARGADLRSVSGLLDLMSLHGLGPRRAIAVAKRYATLEQLRCAPDGEVKQVLGPVPVVDVRNLAFGSREPSWPEGTRAAGFFDDAYPPALRDIDDPPAVVWVRGEVPTMPGIAIVGTRRPTPWSIDTAAQVSAEAVAHGFAVVSGLALGVDAVAHQACLDADGRTVAVLASGVDTPTPAANRALAERIVAQGGCLLAEVPPGARPSKRGLVARDRLQSGLARATVVIQTGIPGGTLHTARFTIQQDRLLVVTLPNRNRVDGDADPYAGNEALAAPEGCNPEILRANGSLATKIAARRPAADLVVARREDLGQLWAKLSRAEAREEADPGGVQGNLL